MSLAAKPKPKKCRVCPERFTPRNSLQVVCSVPCAQVLAKKQQAKEKAEDDKRKRRDAKKRKEALLSVSDWTKKAQKAFNAYVRERDREHGCISCSKPANATEALTGGYWDCGHYRSTGACPELRFEPLNAHKQCKQCNNQLSGNVVEYRINLINRIGAENLEWLEGPHEPKRYRIEDLRQIEAHFKALRKELIKGRGE